MPAAGYAYAIDPRIIDKSLKRRLIVKAQNKKFVQCVSPSRVSAITLKSAHVSKASSSRRFAAFMQ